MKFTGLLLIASQFYLNTRTQSNVGIGTNKLAAWLDVIGTTNNSAASVLQLKRLDGTTLFQMRIDGNTRIGIAPGDTRVRINSTTTSNKVVIL